MYSTHSILLIEFTVLQKDILIPVPKMLKCVMSLRRIFEEREKKREILQQDALREARRLVPLLKERYEYDSIYLCGSILSNRFGNRSDIDIIIKGLKTDAFFKAYALLIKESTYRIDLKPFEDMTADFQSEVLTKGIKIG
ncbi:MAG: hypothetical protein A2Z47_01390 [Thermodesulfovibrio sp. RBG_19FT_COMBO_42_12]|nr:MAG: hypothetical protein A2Z47_01390 [Thermodesulfovibrio sp. RBG_19FT_COMBO_42_12]